MKTDAPLWAPPLLALQFLTRLPLPWLDRLTPGQARAGLTRAAGWLPLVGGAIGSVTALVFHGAGMFWPMPVAAVLALAAEAWLTGALHEDAVADFCDGFGGGHTPEDIRRIMKDSRIGSYGAVGLGLAMALRLAAMLALPPEIAFAAIPAAAALGRLCAVAVMVLVAPAPAGGGLARDIGRPRRGAFVFGAASTAAIILPLALTAPWAVAGGLAAALLFLGWFNALLRRRLGGSTGDCLGFAAYAGQLILLLATAAVA